MISISNVNVINLGIHIIGILITFSYVLPTMVKLLVHHTSLIQNKTCLYFIIFISTNLNILNSNNNVCIL